MKKPARDKPRSTIPALLHRLPPMRILGVHQTEHFSAREAEARLTTRDQFVAHWTVGEQGSYVAVAGSFAETGRVVRRTEFESHLSSDAGL